MIETLVTPMQHLEFAETYLDGAEEATGKDQTQLLLLTIQHLLFAIREIDHRTDTNHMRHLSAGE